MSNKSNNTKTATKSDIALVRLDMKDMEQRIDDKNRGYKDEILTGLDEVMGELQTRREEDSAGTKLIRELDVKADDHEKRIASLETA